MKWFIFFCIVSTLFSPVVVLAEDETILIEEEDAGMLPTNAFYFLDLFFERVKEWLTLSSEKKAELHQLLAIERLAEMSKLQTMKDIPAEKIEQIKAKIEQHQVTAERYLEKAKEKTRDIEEGVDTIFTQYERSKTKINQIQDSLNKRFETPE